MTTRRHVLILLGIAAIGAPTALRAQPQPVRIALLGMGGAQSSAIFVEAFKQGLGDNELREGLDYVLETYWAEGHAERWPALAAELVQRNPRAIVVTTITAARAAQRATTTIPIIMTGINDPVEAGLIASLAHPGGNTTGVASMVEHVVPKLVEILHDALPRVRVIAVLLNPTNPSNHQQFQETLTQAGSIKIKAYPIEVEAPSDIEARLALPAQQRPGAILLLRDAMLIDSRERIVALTLRSRVPLLTFYPELTDAGALISYGPSVRDIYRRSAYYVKKVLDGVPPADLPVERPTRFELSVNLKTAKALGIHLPHSLLRRADRVIE